MRKKIVSAVSLIVALALIFPVCGAFAANVLLGDIDGNGSVEPADARLALRASVGLETILPGTPEFTAADADGNGVIEPADARAVLRSSVALEPLPEDPAEAIAPSGKTDTASGWEAYDELIARIKAETDPAERTALLREADDMLAATNCVIPIYHYTGRYLQSVGVGGIYATPYSTMYFMGADKTGELRVCIATEPYTLDPALTDS
nr:hypothetical protein [Clostridia bacterium]